MKEQNKMDNPSNYFELQWSSEKGVPSIGSLVEVGINGIGVSRVQKYFCEHGYLGLLVQPLYPPQWYIKQNGADQPCHVYASECKDLRKKPVEQA